MAFYKLHIHNSKYAKKIPGVHVRFSSLLNETPLQRIGAIHIGKLVMVNGIIKRISTVSPLLMKAAFICTSCGEIIYIDQMSRFMRTPRECPSCNIRWGFELVPKESVFIDSQRITLQGFPIRKLPRQMDAS